MRAKFLLNQHTRAAKICEMIIECDRRAHEAARYVITHKLSKKWFPFKEENVAYNEKQLSKYTKISHRLQRYYADVMVRLTKPVIERMNNAKPLCDLKIDGNNVIANECEVQS